MKKNLHFLKSHRIFPVMARLSYRGLFSHIDYFLSAEYVEKHKIQVTAESMIVVLSDSVLFYCAGINRSKFVHRGINNYVIPILKQQINLAQSFPRPDTLYGWMRRFLGFDNVPASVNEWCNVRMAKL